MKLTDLKWWHFTLAVIAIAAAVRLATGGPLPFLAPAPQTPAAPAKVAGRPVREPNTGPTLHDTVTLAGASVDQAIPELNRLTIDASIANPGSQAGLIDGTGALVKAIAAAVRKGVSEDSTAITDVRLLVAAKGVDRSGAAQAHLSLYALRLNMGDLYALNPDKVSDAQALGLTRGIVFNDPQIHQGANAWCAQPANQSQAQAFCAAVKAAKGV